MADQEGADLVRVNLVVGLPSLSFGHLRRFLSVVDLVWGVVDLEFQVHHIGGQMIVDYPLYVPEVD